MVICTLFFRTWRVYRILIIHKSASGYLFYLVPFLCYAPCIVIAIASTIAHGAGPAIINGELMCWQSNWAQWAFIGHILMICIVITLMGVRLRTVRHQVFNEFVQISVAFFSIIFGMVLYGILATFQVQFFAWGRIVMMLVVVLISNMVVWSFCGKPLYDSFFRPIEAQKAFDLNLSGRALGMRGMKTAERPSLSSVSNAGKSSETKRSQTDGMSGSIQDEEQVQTIDLGFSADKVISELNNTESTILSSH